MIRMLAYVVIIIVFALVVFFGLGPVFIADGSTSERLVTLTIAVMILAVLIILFRAAGKIKT